MAESVKPIPDGYGTITPYLIIDGAAAAIDYYKSTFGAREVMRMDVPGQKVGHAELMIGDSKIMLADEFPEMGAKAPKSFGGSPVSLHVYVEDVDRVFKRAVESGSTSRQAVEDKFYGDRTGTIEDPFGHVWHIATHKEDVPPEEMEKRMKAMAKGQ